uniref:Geminin n=1 Tax=Anopheles maculatus TaxID=74869 RepID=A0A182SKW8_9DIPT
MSAASTSNIVISEDTPSEQEEIRKASRMTLKEVQNVVSTWKENFYPGKAMMTTHAPGVKENPVVSAKPQPTEPKRCKMVEQATQTTLEDEQNLTGPVPQDSYWAKLSEKRRHALKETLDENARLHMELSEKDEELNNLRNVVESLQSLVETVVEMLNEQTDTKTTAPDETPKVDDSGIAHSLLDDGTEN